MSSRLQIVHDLYSTRLQTEIVTQHIISLTTRRPIGREDIDRLFDNIVNIYYIVFLGLPTYSSINNTDLRWSRRKIGAY